MPRDPYIREKFTREISHAMGLLRTTKRYPNDRYETKVYNIEFVMKRLREPKGV
jgi:hypothetical protein